MARAHAGLPATGSHPAKRERLLRVAVVAIVASPILVKVVLFPSYPGSDDAFIHLRMAALIESGLGWGINPGQWVNMSTSPLFTLIVAGLDRLGLPPIGAAQTLSALASSAGLAFLYLSARRLSTSQPAAVCVTAFAAVNTQLWRWTGTVMETSSAFAAVAALLYLDLRWPAAARTRRQWVTIGVVVGLAALLRFELLVLVPILLGTAVVRSRDRTSSGLGLLAGVAAPLVPYLAYAAVRFDQMVPTTFSAKSDGWHLVDLDVVRPVVSAFLSAQPLIGGLAIIGVALALRRRGPGGADDRARIAVASLLVAAWLGFYLLRFSGLQSAGRYLVPLMAAVGFLAAASIDPLCAAMERVAARSSRLRMVLGRPVAIVAVLAIAQVAALGAFTAVNIVPVLQGYNDGYRAAMRATAAGLGALCSEGARVLVEVDIGTIAYEDHGDCEIVDGGGLADPGLANRSVRDTIVASRPDLVVETLAPRRGALQEVVGCLRLESSRSFPSHSVAQPDRTYTVNVYRVPAGCPS